MARAFIVHARNDLADVPRTGESHGLQVLDLWPNSSSRNQIQDPPGQTGYLPFQLINQEISIGAVQADKFDDTYYGLSAYIADMVWAIGPAKLTDVQAMAIAADIRERVALGLTLTDIDILGLGVADGWHGSVSDVLRILSGEVYRVEAGQEVTLGTAGLFVTAPSNYAPGQRFTSIGGVEVPVGGQTPFRGPLAPNGKPKITDPSQDYNYRNVRVFEDSTSLRLSAHSGMLSKYKSADFKWNSGGFVYGAAGTAKAIDGTPIAKDGKGRALVVYAEDGTVI